jgi:hypothetical protein
MGISAYVHNDAPFQMIDPNPKSPLANGDLVTFMQENIPECSSWRLERF